MKQAFTLAARLWFIVGVLISGYFISTIIGFILSQHTETRLQNVSDYLFPASGKSQLALLAFNEQIRYYSDAVIMRDETFLKTAGIKADEVRSVLQALSEMPGLGASRMEMISSISEQYKIFTKSAPEVYSRINNFLSDQYEEDEISLHEKAKNIAQEGDDIQNKLISLTKILADDVKKELSNINDIKKKHRKLNLIIFICLSVCTCFAMWFIIRRFIVIPLNNAIKGLNENSRKVEFASGNILISSQFLAEGSSRQAASSEEATASLEQMSSATRQNAEHAREADNLMKNTKNIMETANKLMDELNKSMSEISSASTQTYDIIKIIDEIAFQTNLLALNAAVEAARAGESGAGFAVVADEVRNLAGKTAEAAKSTSVLIEGIVDKIEAGTEIVVRTDRAFSDVAEISIKIADLVGEIAIASDEQAAGIDEVSNMALQTDKISQQNISSAREISSVSEELNVQSAQMKYFVDDLLSIIRGKARIKR